MHAVVAHQSNSEGGCEGEPPGLAVQLLEQRHRHHLPQRLLLLVLERILEPRQRTYAQRHKT